MKLTFRYKGGAGSGHFGHEGRPGEQGGSLPGQGGGSAGGWKTSSSGAELTKGDVKASINLVKDGRSTYYTVLFEHTKSDRHTWAQEDFSTWESEHSEKRNVTPADLEKAKKYVETHIDMMNERYAQPKPKVKRPRRRGPKQPGTDYAYYD